MTFQQLETAAVGVLITVIAWMLKKVHSLEVLVAGDYVTREEYNDAMIRLHEKVDKILEKL